MIKYLALTLMIVAPISASALTAEQEFDQKCNIKLSARATNVPGNSIYKDKRICECVKQEVKGKLTASEFQDMADFYSEKYAGRPEVKGAKVSLGHVGSECLLKFYTREQIVAENKKINQANTAVIEKRKQEMEKMKAERDKKIAEAQAAFKKEMSAKKNVKQTAPARNFTPIPAKQLQKTAPAKTN